MKILGPLFGLALLASTSALLAVDAPPTDVVIVPHAKVDAAFGMGGPMLITSQYKIQAGRRVAPGAVEIHDHDTDIFYVTEGSATIITGGTPSGGASSGPGETRGGTIANGVERKISKGDVIVIPAGIPHLFKEVSGTFLYFVVKVTG